VSNRTNPRRGDKRRSEHGPRYENGDPGKGCNSTHVAKGRKDWKTIRRRKARREGKEEIENQLIVMWEIRSGKDA